MRLLISVSRVRAPPEAYVFFKDFSLKKFFFFKSLYVLLPSHPQKSLSQNFKHSNFLIYKLLNTISFTMLKADESLVL